MDSIKINTISFYTLGCKLNFSETSTIARDLLKNGYQKIEFGKYSDAVVINTCSVTENSDKECKNIINRSLKINPKMFIVVIGCYAQLKSEQVSQIIGVNLVLGAQEKFNLSYYLNLAKKNKIDKVYSSKIQKTNYYIESYSLSERTRSFLKVQDGCDYKCSYCTIPLARGISRSDSLKNILKNAIQISNQGIKEIVLTGVNIGDYGKGEFGNKTHQHTFLNLVTELDKISQIKRIRISSIEPNLLKNEIINKVLESKKFVPHFHIPLQSGSNFILKKMKRRYSKELYSDRISYIKTKIPDACISVDVITGFPLETEELFLETYYYLNSLDISYLHVFTYSERENTEAISFCNSVPIGTRKKRNKMLQILSEKKKRKFYLSQIGKSKIVLWERENKNGMMYGFTENYVRVKTIFNSKKINVLEKIILENFSEEGIYEV